MKPSNPGKRNAQIYEDASLWLVEFRAGDVDAAQRKQFNAWLRTSPEHMRAYLELAAIWHEGPRLDPTHRFDADEPAGSTSAGATVIALDRMSEVRPPQGTPSARFSTRIFAMAAAVLLAVLGIWAYGERNTYATGIGEQRSLALDDGSTIDLNARSKIRVRFAAERRVVELLEGQALFRVAKDKTRPFIVQSDATQVRAVGTEFDVNRRKNGTTVTVLEGRVAVVPPVVALNLASPGALPVQLPLTQRASAGAGPRAAEVQDLANEQQRSASGSTAAAGEFLLAAGEQAVLTEQAAIKTDQPNLAAVVAWTQRRLVFESTTLAEVAEEFNRYNKRLLVIEGAELADFRITGVFASTDPASLIRFLQARPGIVVIAREDAILVTRQPQ